MLKSTPWLVAVLTVVLVTGCDLSSLNGDRPDFNNVVDNSEDITDSANTESPLPSGVSEALQSGNADAIDAPLAEVEAEVAQSIQSSIDGQNEFLAAIYGENAINYVPSRHSQFVNATTLSDSYSLLTGVKGGSLATAREQNGFRTVGFGTNILVELQNGNLVEYQSPMENIVDWLVGGTPAPVNVVTAMLPTDTVNKSNAWLLSHFGNTTTQNCEPADAQTCLTSDVHLLVVGSSSTATESEVQAFMARAAALKIPTLYVHVHAWNATELTDDVLAPLGFSMQGPGGPGNYFSQDSATYTHYQNMVSDTELQQFVDLAERLAQNNFSYDLAGCDTGSCGNVTAFNDQFKSAANTLKNKLSELEKNGINIFQQEGYGILKRLVLLGDLYRQQVDYPMDKTTTDVNAFTKALFADYAIYNLRDYNPVPNDLGNFSRTDFSHITPTSKTVAMNSQTNFRAAGVYALPGQTVTVTRTDSATDLNIRVFVNTQRSAATHEFETNGYNRPKFLQTAGVNIAPGQTLRFTSAYGGPIQLAFSASGIDSELQFSGIGLHPYWTTGMNDADFLAALAKDEYDWAEIAAERFEVHSSRSKMLETLSDVNFSTPSVVASEAMENLYNQAHVLAGFTGPFVEQEAEIFTYANAIGMTVPTVDVVKHMTADQATCGYGCSGNPYDAYWAFNPISHGDIHEFGHGLENGRFKPQGRDGHATTNFYSYYSKSQYYQRTGLAPQCQGLPFENHFNLLQAAQNSADAFAYMNSADINGWSDGALIMIQFFMIAQQQGTLTDGWLTLPRLHLFSRALDNARSNETAWLAARDQLGMSAISFNEAKDITNNNNDFLLLALASALQLDFRDYFNMYGLTVSSVAANQVAAATLTQVSRTFYAPANSSDYCLSMAQPALAVDGTTAWPN